MRVFQFLDRRVAAGGIESAVFGLVCAAALLLLHGALGAVHWWSISGYILIGMIFSFAELAADRLWEYTVGNMFKRSSPIAAFCARILFWYVAGGAGYTFGMILAKRIGLMGFYDIPVKPIFNFGAMLGVAFQVTMQIVLYLTIRMKTRRPSMGSAGS
ncbi:MAG TPA: hypothetical protein VGR15_10175 [Bacteroidota bacterium]|jgi:hypothetical protein|nr:hypothetical protein [Bacteroidota bacterium]